MVLISACTLGAGDGGHRKVWVIGFFNNCTNGVSVRAGGTEEEATLDEAEMVPAGAEWPLSVLVSDGGSRSAVVLIHDPTRGAVRVVQLSEQEVLDKRTVLSC